MQIIEASIPVPTLRISGAEALVDADASDTPRVDLWISGDRIVAVTAPGDAIPLAWQSVDKLDASGCLAIPGLVDAHCHSYTSMLPGTVAGSPLDLFVLDAMARRTADPIRSVAVASQLHALGLLKRGITSLVDHFRFGALPTHDAMVAALRAYELAGIRATVAPMYEDLAYVDSLPMDKRRLPADIQARWAGMAKPPPAAYFELMDSLLDWRGCAGRLDVMLGVDGPQRCSEALLELTGNYAERHAMGLHTHLLEAKTQRMMAPSQTGGSFVAHLDRFGLVKPASSLVHFVWCTQRDMELAAERGVNVVHNPGSNLHLGSGIQPTARLLQMGVDVAIGTDSTSTGAPSVLEQARLMTLLSRVAGQPQSQWLTPRDAFRAATTGGARVLGLQGQLGALRAGFRADVTLIDIRGLDWRPRGDTLLHLVMHESGHNVRHVVVAGEVVVRDRRSTRIDEDALLEEAQELRRADDAASAASLATADAERPSFLLLIEEALATPLPEQRHIELR